MACAGPHFSTYWALVEQQAAMTHAQYLRAGPLEKSLIRPIVMVGISFQAAELEVRPHILQAVPSSIRESAFVLRQISVTDLLHAALV